jgi:hypothetical protein
MLSLRLAVVVFVAAGSLKFALAQAAPTSSPPPSEVQHVRPQSEAEEREAAERAASPATASKVPPTEAVITIAGVCEGQAAAAKTPKGECKTVITRAEFERLANTLQPNMPPQVRKQLANQYPQILYMAQEARKRGLENDPHYLAVLKFTKMELLRMELEHSLEKKADEISDAEIQSYYTTNAKNYEQATLKRVFIPRARQSDAAQENATPDEMLKTRQESAAAMEKVANDLHTRAAAGEDFDKLQKEAYEAAGVKSSPPPTTNSKIRRAGLPPSQAVALDMKTGELSPVINDAQGFFIYRLVEKTTPPLGDVKSEIRNTLYSQRLQEMRSKIQNAVSADLNKEYFGDTPGAPEKTGQRPNNHERPTPPAVQHPQ